jgi:DNA mismatch repair protein MutL
MIFNGLSKGENGFHSQLLLTPVAVSLSGAEYAAVAENLPLFRQAGYEIEEFGANTVLVRSCPVELTQENVSALVQELAGKLLSGDRAPVPEKLSWLWHSTACRAAIKGGDEMTLQEMQSFVDRLLADPDVRYCPHGRPVLYELSRHELEKQFGRLG